MTGGSSISHGHTDMVLTLPLVFLMTVIFMCELRKKVKRPGAGLVLVHDRRLVDQPGAHRHRLDLAARLLDDRDFHDRCLQLTKVVDDDVYEPGAEGAVLAGVLGLLTLRHLLLLRNCER